MYLCVRKRGRGRKGGGRPFHTNHHCSNYQSPLTPTLLSTGSATTHSHLSVSISLTHTILTFCRLFIQPPILTLTHRHIMVGIFRKSAPQSAKPLNICLKKIERNFILLVCIFSCSLSTLNPFLIRTHTIRLTQVLLFSPGCMCAGQIR